MNVVIIGNGKIKDTSILQKDISDSTIICCDGGAMYAFKEGITPNYVIGDLDSASPQIIQFFEKKGVKFEKFSKEKNETDMEICVDFAIKLMAKKIVLFGAIGTRIDHTLANIQLLIKGALANIDMVIIDSHNEIRIVREKLDIYGKKGDIVSLIPLTNSAKGVSTDGLYYPLYNAQMDIGKTIGVSNVMLDNNATIYTDEGYLLAIKSKD